MPTARLVRETGSMSSAFWERRDGFKSWGIKPRPILEYELRCHEKLSGYTAGYGGTNMGYSAGYEESLKYARSYNQAYERFVAKLGDRSELGTSLAEFRSSLSMVSQRALQLMRGWGHLKRGRFRSFLKEFGITPKPKDKGRLSNRPKQAGSLWLEYWMGWAPTVGDMHASALVLTSVPPSTRIKTVGKTTFRVVDPYDPQDGWLAEGKTICRLEADVEVTNPNLFLANQLGLINPAQILYNLMPWSWMIGWFVNFSQIISSFTDFAGLKLSRICRTYHSVWHTWRYRSGGLWDRLYPQYQNRYRCVSTRRAPLGSFRTPKLVLTLPRLSFTRAATLVSLLVQKLKS